MRVSCVRPHGRDIAFAIFILAGCPEANPSALPPKNWRRLVYVDESATVSLEERHAWPHEILALAGDCRDSLWNRTASNEIVVLPLHAYTQSATPIARQTLSGSELERTKCYRSRAQFSRQLDSMALLQFQLPVRKWSDILGSIDEATRYLNRDTLSVRDLYYFSDMLHDAPPGVRLVGASAPRGPAAAVALAERLVSEHQWAPGQLSGVSVHVRLPGTISGATSAGVSNDPATIEAFWRRLFELLGARVVSWSRF